MRRVGLALILGGSLATIGAMFLPAYRIVGSLIFRDPLNWWEIYNGLDIALTAACAITACLALLALSSANVVTRQLAVIAGAVVFGLAFAAIPGAIDDPTGYRAGFWITAGAGTIPLAGAVFLSLSDRD
jgi:hypothetical protein